MGHFSYFGYGSLINDATRPKGYAVQDTRLSGWRREWRVHTAIAEGWHGLSGVCSLGIYEHEGSVIEGVAVREPLSHLTALDRREDGYERLTVHDGDLTPRPSDFGSVYVYRALDERRKWATSAFPILQSYIDCVLQGVLNRKGKEGLERFFETTDGWHLPIFNDRERPVYPRAVQLSDRQQSLFDEFLMHYSTRS